MGDKILHFDTVNVLVKKEHHYVIERQYKKDIYFASIQSLFKNKYNQSEINKSKVRCVGKLEERINFMKTVLVYLLGPEYTEDIFTLNKNKVNFNNMFLLYNNVLKKKYKEENLNLIEEYLVTKYGIYQYYSFMKKEEAIMDDIIYLFDFILYEYKSYFILLEQLNIFFSNLCGDSSINCDLLEYLFYQMEYLFFLFICDTTIELNALNKYVKTDAFINLNIYQTSICLKSIFSVSNCGMYNAGVDLNDPFLGFIDSNRRALSVLIEDPNSNKFDVLEYYNKHYYNEISPFVVNKNNHLIFHMTDDMISFDYLHNLIGSFCYLSLNTMTFFFRYLLQLEKYIKNKNDM